ncbi:MAG TPA: hypothetical protein VJK03_00810 [Candidatus Nanoarchaeia archaeon]|nr:hypothetical protein [Candidatus Nanoarchaeia archaeon]
MKYNNLLVSLVAAFALLIMISSVSAFVASSQVSVEVSGIDNTSAGDISVVAGQAIPVRVIFTPFANATEVQVEARVTGGRGYASITPEFDVIAGRTYSRFLTVQVPSNVDPSEEMKLEVTISSDATGEVVQKKIALTAQRESHVIEILDVAMDSTVQAGEQVALDIVLKNRGSHFAEDTFFKVSVPALGIERRAYFGDLSPVDQSDPDKEDAAERRMFLPIPANAPAGIYAIEFEAFDADASTTVSKKFAVVSAGGASSVVSPTSSKTVAVGEVADYSVILVNSGKTIRVYELSVDAPAELTVEADEQLVVLPAGTTKTVKVHAQASKAGRYPFSVDVTTDGNLVKKESFTANVESGATRRTGATSMTSTTVVITVILAVIFVVLLIVLIVLLTRKPQKTEELGESYY